MSNNTLVEHTYKKHHTWLIQCSYNLTNNKLEAENLVQDLYLKLLDMDNIQKLVYKNDINIYYLYKMLRSMFLNGQKNNINTLSINENLFDIADEEYDIEADNEWEKMLKLTNEALDNTYWFDRNLFKVYLEENHSIQSLHNVTGISNSTIWTSMKKTKSHIKKYVNENM